MLADGETDGKSTKMATFEITESPRASHFPPPPEVGTDTSHHRSDTQINLSPSSQPLSAHFPLLRAECVSIHGNVRPMCSDALRIPEDGVGVVKAAPVERWLAGQKAWDAKFKRIARGVERERATWEKKAIEVMRKAGLNEAEIDTIWQQRTKKHRTESSGSMQPTSPDPVHGTATLKATNLETIPEVDDAERICTGHRWGPLDLIDEVPPPSAIAGRLDTPDAVDLLKTSLSQMPCAKLCMQDQNKAKQTVASVLQGSTQPARPRRYSAAEQQVPANPLHGVRMWGGIMG